MNERGQGRSEYSLKTLALVALVGLFIACTGFSCGGDAYHAYYPPDPTTRAIQNALKALSPGKIAFESPTLIKQSESKIVRVRISKNLNEDLGRGIGDSGNLQTKDIKVSPVMSLKLTGSAFKIDPITPEQQAVAENDYTEWSWMVHPLDWGDQLLTLSVCAKLDISKTRTESRCAFSSNYPIKVKTDPVYAVTHFVKDDPKWSITTLGSALGVVFGGLVAGVKKLTKRRSAMGFHP